MKKILLLVMAMLTSVSTKMMACWSPAEYEGGTSFRIVQPFPDYDTAYRGSALDETVSFWYNYLKKSVKQDDIKAFFESAPHTAMTDEEYNNNAFLLAVKKDAYAAKYLSACLALQGTFTDSWVYSDQEECMNKAVRLVNELDSNVPVAFEYRMTLLKMRLNYARGNYNEVEQLWTEKGTNCTDKALHNRMKGYYAGVLYHKELYSQAINLYAELGDQLSMRWCISQFAGYKGIKTLIDNRTSENDQAVYYALQDYANYYYNNSYDQDYASGNDERKELKSDGNRVKQLCLEMVDKSKSDKIVWLSAVAWIELLDGHNSVALKYATDAMKQKGTTLQKENAERIMMLARLKCAPTMPDDKTLKQLASDFMTLYTRSMNEFPADIRERETNEYRSYFRAYCPNYCFLMDTYRVKLIEYFQNHKMVQATLITKNLCEQILSKSEEGSYSAWSQEWFCYLDRDVTLEDAAAFTETVKTKKCADVYSQQLIKKFDGDDQIMHDLMGTKCMREGKYSLALNHFNQLTSAYMSGTHYRDYLLSRSLETRKPFERSERNYHEDGENIVVSVNIKAQFCQQMIDRINALNNQSGDEKAKNEIEMAKMMFQASNMGDLWALSEFGITNEDYMQPNKLCAQARVQLNNALKDCKSEAVRFDAYYGLACVPTGERFWTYEIDWNSRTGIYRFTSFHPARAAYDYLKSHRNIRDLVSTCDVLKWYAKSN